jgi:hypothetical protein
VAEALKEFFNPEIVRRSATMISAVHADFPAEKFVADAVKGLNRLELVPRGAHRKSVAATPASGFRSCRGRGRSFTRAQARGHRRVLGFGRAPNVRVEGVEIKPARPAIGTAVQLSFDLVNAGRRKQTLIVDYRVFFVKASGKTSAKVMKLKTVELAARESVRLSTRLSLRQMTTRTHYPGAHKIEEIVNGKSFALGQFYVMKPTMRRR